MYMCKDDLALNNQRGLLCHKTKLNQTLFYDTTIIEAI